MSLPLPAMPSPARQMVLFATATLLPLALVLFGAFHGAGWAWAGVLWVGLCVLALDILGPRLKSGAPEGAEFPAGDGLLLVIALAHFVAMPLVVRMVAGPGDLSAGGRFAVFLAMGLWLGQVANPAAHELIHRSDRRLFRLGAAMFSSLLFGHHTSAHRLVHHRHVASPDDPNSARAGESFWHFLPRAWAGSFRKGLRAESTRRQGRAGIHPYLWYGAGSAAALFTGWIVAGWPGVAVWLALAFHAQVQLLLSDYVQHYGLMRRTLPDGRMEPVAPAHSWNAPHWFSAGMMLNAPLHSDHHAHPARPYPGLRLPVRQQAPRLPLPLPLCCTLALMPRLWRRLIDPQLARWHDQTADPSSPPISKP